MNKFHVIPCIITYCYIPPNHPNLHVPIIRVFFAILSFDVMCCPTLSYLQPTHTHTHDCKGGWERYIHTFCLQCNAFELEFIPTLPHYEIQSLSSLYSTSSFRIVIASFILFISHLLLCGNANSLRIFLWGIRYLNCFKYCLSNKYVLMSVPTDREIHFTSF